MIIQQKNKVLTISIISLMFVIFTTLTARVAMAQEGGEDPIPHSETPCSSDTINIVPAKYTGYYTLCVGPHTGDPATIHGLPLPNPYQFSGGLNAAGHKIYYPGCKVSYKVIEMHHTCESNPNAETGEKCVPNGIYKIKAYGGNGHCNYISGNYVGCAGFNRTLMNGYPKRGGEDHALAPCGS